MSHPDVERRLTESAPAGPRRALRERVLAAVEDELRRPTPAIDRFLSRPLPWAIAAALLVALMASVRAQVAEEERGRATRLDVGATRRAAGRAAGEVAALLGDARVAAWVRDRLLAQSWADRGKRTIRGGWPAAPSGDDLR